METEYDYYYNSKNKPKSNNWLAIAVLVTFVIALLCALWYIIDCVRN